VLDELTSLMKNHLDIFIGTIKPLYNLFNPPCIKDNLTETGIQDAITFLPKTCIVDQLNLLVE